MRAIPGGSASSWSRSALPWSQSQWPWADSPAPGATPAGRWRVGRSGLGFGIHSLRRLTRPERYGKWKTLHKRFSRWSRARVWERVFDDLSRNRDNQYLMLDSTLVRAHQQAATGK